MDRRNLIFIASLSLTLLLVNLFFSYQEQGRNKTWLAQQEINKARQRKELSKEITQRTVKPAQLPLVDLYADANGQHFLNTGVRDGQAILALSWSESLPKQIYVRDFQSSSPLEKVDLIRSSTGLHTPVVYSSTQSPGLKIGQLGTLGRLDLQMVGNAESTHQPQVTIADYIDSRFDVPAKRLKGTDDEKPEWIPTSDALALLKTSEGYLPVGVFSLSTNQFTPLNEYSHLGTLTEVPQITVKTKPVVESAETYFVLEDGYQQLVFSNRGGALAEINLPFQGRADTESVVKEIEIDREMVAQHPNNAYFPLHAYYTPGKDPSGPFVEHQKGNLGGYYPLLRRDLVSDKGQAALTIQPHYYATNLVSEYPELAELIYEVKHFDSESIVFEAVQSHRRITKTYRLPHPTEGAPYCVELDIAIEGDSRGLWLTSGIPDVELISGAAAPALKYRVTRQGKSEVEPIELPRDTVTMSSFHPNWLCDSNGFFGLILDPLTPVDAGFKALRVSGKTAPSRLIALDTNNDRFKAADLPGYEILIPLKSQAGTTRLRLFAGPFAETTLKTVDAAYSDPATGYNPDYIACQSFHGWFAFISEPFAKFLFVLMKFFHYLTGSWGFSIILLTVALRLMLYPLNAWSTKSMVAMQQIGPDITAIQEKYKKDPKKAQMAIMNLYRERGVNPLSGCFPLIIQLPFLIGMFDLLKSTFELRGAGFIPGWIDNLTAPDVLFSWSTPIFFIGNEFHLLPILLGLVMFLQQRLMSPTPKDPKLLTDQQKQQRMMGNMMTVVFAVMFYQFPSGLNIYWLSSMLLGMLQQWYTARSANAKKPPTELKNVQLKDKQADA